MKDIPDGRQHLTSDGDLNLHFVLVPHGALNIAEAIVEAVLGFAGRPGAFNKRFPQILVAVSYSPRLDFSGTLLIAGLESCPRDKMSCGLKGVHIGSHFGNNGRGGTGLYARNGLKVGVLLREVLFANLIHLGLTFILVPLCKLNFFAKLSYGIYISCGDDAGKGTYKDIFTKTVDCTTMYMLDEFFGIGLAFTDETDNLLIGLPPGGGYIVADADIAPLEGRIQLGQLIHDILLQVKDASVILT